MRDYSALQVLWFVLIGVLWAGYFVLEGFDFGVGMLLRLLGRDHADRRAMIHTIGPVWDGNEVWLIVAGGATFAAFPQWYATLFSGFYIALFLVLLALIARGVAFEFWGKDGRAAWAAAWEWAITIGSFLAALLWGVAWANIVHGVPIDAKGNADGSLTTLLNPYAILGGLTTVSLFLSLGAIFLTLRTKGDLTRRSRRLARLASPAAAAAATAFLAWTIVDQSHQSGVEIAVTVLAIVAVALSALAQRGDRDGVAFALGAAGVAALVATFFVDLFPHTMVSTTDPAYSLTLDASASSHYTLTVMTIVAVILLPVVLAYQAWTYWVFRRRIGPEDFVEHVRNPLALLGGRGEGDAPAGG
jgi:cytochrome bd ubiquinol oxidase subunit II